MLGRAASDVTRLEHVVFAMKAGKVYRQGARLVARQGHCLVFRRFPARR
jgi:hypothetical protein